MFTLNNAADCIIFLVKLLIALLFFYKFLTPKFKTIIPYILFVVLIPFAVILLESILLNSYNGSSENFLYMATILLLSSEILLFFLATMFLFKDTAVLKLCSITLYIICNISAMQISGIFDMLFLHNKNQTIFKSALSYEVIYILFFSFISIFLTKLKIPKNIKFSSSDIPIMLIPVIVYIIPFAFYLISCSFLIIIIYIINKVSKENNYISKELLLQKQLSTQNEYISSILKSNEQIRRIQHDMGNHLNCIKTLLNKRQYEEALNYLSEVSHISALPNLTCSSGHPAIDAVFCEKLALAQKNSMKLNINSMLLKDISIKPFDIAVILFNSIDNAINYISKTPSIHHKEISATISKKSNYLLIKVSNPIDNEFIAKARKIINLKKELMSKGLGLSNIELTVQKYNGNMELVVEDNVFTLIVLLQHLEN